MQDPNVMHQLKLQQDRVPPYAPTLSLLVQPPDHVDPKMISNCS